MLFRDCPALHETPLLPENGFGLIWRIELPPARCGIVNPNNPTAAPRHGVAAGSLRRTDTRFLVDEAFIGLAGKSVVPLVPAHPNLLVTRTLSKAHSLAGFRVGYAVLPQAVADDLNQHNDAYPLARPSEAAAVATLQHERDPRRNGSCAGGPRLNRSCLLGRALTRPRPISFRFHTARCGGIRTAEGAGHFVKPLNDPRLGRLYACHHTAGGQCTLHCGLKAF
jgi:histidinol-phosphate aminotransferase